MKILRTKKFGAPATEAAVKGGKTLIEIANKNKSLPVSYSTRLRKMAIEAKKAALKK